MTNYSHSALLTLLQSADLSNKETANQVQAILSEEIVRQEKTKINDERLTETRDNLIAAILNHMDTIVEVYSDDYFDIDAICPIDELAQHIETFVKASEEELAPRVQRITKLADKIPENAMEEEFDDDIIQNFLKGILS